MEQHWGRRASDYEVTANTVSTAARAERRMQRALRALVVMAVFTVFVALVITWRAGEKVKDNTERTADLVEVVELSVKQAELASKRNTELLSVKCDLETGRPIAHADGKRFVNTTEFLHLFCTNQVERANQISEYITQINSALREQVQAHEDNTSNSHDRIEALAQRKLPPSRVRRPIPATRPATLAAQKSAPTATTASPPPEPPPPTSTTTICVKHKRERCRDK